MEKGESLISIAITALLVLVALAVQRRWSSATFKNMAASAETFVLTTAGLRGQIPSIAGFEKVRTFYLGRYRAALYRKAPAPLVFASYRFVIYDLTGKPIFKVNTLEATTTPWTTLYDFAGRHGRPDLKRPGGPLYSRDLTVDGKPDAILGQYSGGDHCCTTATVIELDKTSVKIVGQIGNLDGLPFEGLDLVRLDRRPGYQFVAHRPYRTVCGQHVDDADVLAVYAWQNGKFTDQTASFHAYLNRVLQRNLALWRREKSRSLHLLQTLATNYAEIGQPDTGRQFFEQNLPLFSDTLRTYGVDQRACQADLAELVQSVALTPSQ